MKMIADADVPKANRQARGLGTLPGGRFMFPVAVFSGCMKKFRAVFRPFRFLWMVQRRRREGIVGRSAERGGVAGLTEREEGRE